MLRFTCPYCRATLNAPREKALATVRCLYCQKPVRIPAAPRKRGSRPILAFFLGNFLGGMFGLIAGAAVVALVVFGYVSLPDKPYESLANLVSIGGDKKADAAPPGDKQIAEAKKEKSGDPWTGPSPAPDKKGEPEPKSEKKKKTEPPAKKAEPKPDPKPEKKKQTQPPPKNPEPKPEPKRKKVEKKKAVPKPPPPKKKKETKKPQNKSEKKKDAEPPQPDELTYPRTVAEIRKKLIDISTIAKPPADAVDLERERALRRLQMYRYLAGIPYKQMKLDDKMNQYAEAAARICEKLGRLDHNPKNPGWPEKEYKIALTGARNCNLFFTFPKANLPLSVDAYMNDSDPGNIVLLGHRRWCLFPGMGKTGFGMAGKFAGMWSTDRSQPLGNFDFVAWPPRGYAPLEFFQPKHAWCVSPHPGRFRVPKTGVKPAIYPMDENKKKSGPALALNHSSINRLAMGLPNCIIFRPSESAVAPGRRYLVEITGLVDRGGKAVTLRYPVEFVRLQK